MPIEIVVDTNPGEDHVFQHLERISHNVIRRRLDVGDVQATIDDKIVVFERKTWSDLASSICDGRWKEQKARMMNSQDDHPTKYMYIIEGPLLGWASNIHGMQSKCMWGAIVKTALRDEMPVFHSQTPEDTAEIINYIVSNSDIRRSARNDESAIAGLNKTYKRKRDNMNDTSNVYRAMLSVTPGMSANKADAIMQRWPTLRCLMGATKSELENVMCGNRKLGPVLSAKLCELIS